MVTAEVMVLCGIYIYDDDTTMDPKTTTRELDSTITDQLWTYYAIFGHLT